MEKKKKKSRSGDTVKSLAHDHQQRRMCVVLQYVMRLNTTKKIVDSRVFILSHRVLNNLNPFLKLLKTRNVQKLHKSTEFFPEIMQ